MSKELIKPMLLTAIVLYLAFSYFQKKHIESKANIYKLEAINKK